MTWVDGVLLFVVAISAILAFMRGFVQEVLGVLAWVGAAVVALMTRDALAPMVLQYVEAAWVADAIAIGGVFLAVLVVLKLIIHAVAGRIRSSALGGLDRSLGAVFGVARGAFLAVVAFIVGGLFFPQVENWPAPVRDARALPYVVEGARWLVVQLPPDFRPRLVEPPLVRVPTQDDLLRPPARDRI